MVRKFRMVLMVSVLLAGQAYSQSAGGSTASGQVWQVPFGAKGNTLSLSVENSSSIDADNVSVTFTNLPAWPDFKSNTVMLKSISANSTGDAQFTFSVNNDAPVGKDTTLVALIISSAG